MPCRQAPSSIRHRTVRPWSGSGAPAALTRAQAAVNRPGLTPTRATGAWLFHKEPLVFQVGAMPPNNPDPEQGAGGNMPSLPRSELSGRAAGLPRYFAGTEAQEREQAEFCLELLLFAVQSPINIGMVLRVA